MSDPPVEKVEVIFNPIHQLEVKSVNKSMFKNIVDKRGINAVKRYVHRHGTYDCENNYINLSTGRFLVTGDKCFLKFRKKHNRNTMQVSSHQHIVDLCKPIFGLKQIGTSLLHDEVEGYCVLQIWHEVIGTIKQREFMHKWVNDENLLELFKICVFDGVFGSLDRHGNNVVIMTDNTLLTIDDEDQFYPLPRDWIKFDKDIRKMIYMNALKHQDNITIWLEGIKTDEIRAICKSGLDEEFYQTVIKNLSILKDILKETYLQLLR